MLDEWQVLVLRAWLGVRPDGQWAARRCGASVPRQNGKNAVLEVRELFGMVVLGEKFLHTAHEVKTARKAFRRISSFFDEEMGAPAELAAMVEEIRKTNGQEAIVLSNGGSVEFVARSKGSARGFTVDVLVMDEAQELGEDAIEALLPTISAAPLGNPQQIFTGTPPGPKANGEIFTRVRNDGLTGKDRYLSWHEWSCEPDADLDDPANLAAANPGLGARVNRDVTDAERGTLSDAGFGRERLGMWDDVRTGGVLPAPSWQSALDERSAAVDRHTLGVECGPDLAYASVALAGQRADGDWHIELEDDQNTRGAGVAWLLPMLDGLLGANPQIRAVMVDVAGPVAALLEQRRDGRWFFKDSRIEATPIKVAELGASCSLILDGVVTGWLHHIGQPQFTAAALSAGKRPLGDTGKWVWSRKLSTSDVTPIQAATLALAGAQATRVKKPSHGAGRSGGRRTATML